MNRAIGIDLGTSNTVAAVVENGRARILTNREGERLTPSVYAETGDGRRLVGMPAKQRLATGSGDAVASVKRLMGSGRSVMVRGAPRSPREISAAILRQVKADAERELGGPVARAVITVPAYFHHAAREATREAGRMAGFEVLRIISEPTAAALAYGLHRQDLSTVLVWDLGGGTFDVSILELSEGFFEVRAVCGDNRLGGDDWDRRFADHVASRVKAECGVDILGNAQALAQVGMVCEGVKKQLSEKPVARLSLSALEIPLGEGASFEEVMARSVFEEATADLAGRLLPPTRQALSDAGLSVDGIDRVLLVGGATRMPGIRTLAETFFQQQPYLKLNPDEVVAIGAAVQAGILTGQIKDVVLVDVTPLSLGIESQGGLFARLIPRNTTIPTSAQELFTTARDDQASMDLHVLQGEREMASDNISLGSFQLSGIPPLPRGQAHVEVSFSIDADGIVTVSAESLRTEEKAAISIDAMHALKAEEVSQALADADACAQGDLERREQIEASTRAETLIRSVEALVDDPAASLPEDLGRELAAHVALCREVLAQGSALEIRSRCAALKAFLTTLTPDAKGALHETPVEHHAPFGQSGPGPRPR
ncbi:Hsp70 family protein [Desulfoluna spongiiphila]|uniref:Hsp70 family protein n=1 Tax=Desulfoluna spongiiphila TaxID=419481 RepID=UPI001251E71E|nr:Hsp70 family protein [Desulfoluna spongiiphila]VVS92298.1 heat shock protein 70 family [Desulfoluna spongiiphila]